MCRETNFGFTQLLLRRTEKGMSDPWVPLRNRVQALETTKWKKDPNLKLKYKKILAGFFFFFFFFGYVCMCVCTGCL